MEIDVPTDAPAPDAPPAADAPPTAPQGDPSQQQPDAADEGQGEEGQQQPEQSTPFERKLLQSQQVIRRQERELRKSQARMKEMEQRLDKLSELDKLLDEDPLKALERKGKSYDELTKRVLEGEQLTPEQQEQLQLKQKLEALERERDEEKKTAAEIKAQQERTQHVEAIKQAVDANEQYAYIASFGLAPALYDRLQEFARDNGYEPSPEDQGEIAAALETEVREAVHSNVQGLIKRSPQFRQQVAELIKKLDPDQTSSGQTEPTANPRRSRTGAAPKTITRDHLSAVESRKGTEGLSIEEKRARGRERTLKRLGIK